jgi:type VI secretion system secreted protein Hcp
MAVDSYMMFTPYTLPVLDAESQVDLTTDPHPSNNKLGSDFVKGKVFEVDNFSFGIEQVLNIGSQSKGAGAGKVKFNEFTISRKIDKASPTIFQMACSGTPFKTVALAFRKSAGGNTTGVFYLRFDFKLVAVKTISWEYDDESPKENMTFEYGGLIMRYCPQDPDGNLDAIVPGGWNRVTNVADTDVNKVIQ